MRAVRHTLSNTVVVLGVGTVLLGAAVYSNSAMAAASKPTARDADKFVASINDELLTRSPLWNAAAWVAATYITDDTQALSSQATDQFLQFTTAAIAGAKRFDGVTGLKPATARALLLIKLGSSLPAPTDPAKREELSKLSARMEARYGAAKWCRNDAAGNERCLTLPEIERIINNPELSRSPQELTDAWLGWHATAKPMRNDYPRFVELMNEGARDTGFKDTGDLWRGGYDMSAQQFSSEVERLWDQVEPLYSQLHCYVRARLNAKYGDAVVPKHGLIPAQLLGNMWAQDWSNLYPLLQPYPDVATLDVTGSLKALREAELQKVKNQFKGQPSAIDQANLEHAADAATANKMAHIAEDFYTSLGMPKLPQAFWEKSLLVQPRDRDVVCHASAWDFDLAQNDVRIKECIEATEEQLFTIHHELGHIYYYLNYASQPPLFQRGAHDGFHEAIGDTVTLSLTPQHLQKIGLVKAAPDDERALINAQMKKALEKIVFLPWGKLVDQWRWQVFDSEIKPERYNATWWQLRARYQGVAPPVPRNEQDFDPGAKYHVASNTPYTRYFLSFIIQFQFQKALCAAAGFDGPLAKCDIYGNKAAGEKFMAMLREGGAEPWQDTLQKLTGTRQMDGSAIIEYFAPLLKYLREQNQAQQCGWEGEAHS